MALDEILADYEDLKREDILAALDFARQLSQRALSQLWHEVSH